MCACSEKTFGAFHEGTWAGSGWDGSSKADFLFKLGDSLEKFPNKGTGNYVYKGSDYWPLFGNGYDLSWGESGKLGTNNVECIASDYSGHVNNEICGGFENWGTTHLEVWRLAFEGFPNSKIVTKASWGEQINSWLPSSEYILAIYSGVSAAQ